MFEKTGQINRGSIFGEYIYEYTKKSDVKTIFEIGTWNGLGTTKCIYDGIINSNKRDYLVLSLECNLQRHKEAKQNLLPLANFNLIYGSIVSLEEISSIIEDYKRKKPIPDWMYEDILHLKISPYIGDIIPEKIDLLILDGGEFTSKVEFEKLWKFSKYIFLDDTNISLTIKNVEVRKFIIDNPNIFEIIVDDLNTRNGYLISKNLQFDNGTN